MEDKKVGSRQYTCFEGKLYVTCFEDQHFEIDKQKLGNKDDGITQLPIKTLQVPMVIPYQLVGGWETCSLRYYFVETSEDLFYVTIRYNQRAQNKVVIQIAVMKLDFSAMQWEVVNCLGDHVLFIGSNTTACCSAAEVGLERGCLYYTLAEDQSLYKFEVESTGNSVILPCLKLPTPWFYPNWIMVPNGRKREKEMVGGDGSKKSIMKGVNGKQGGEDYGGDFEKACPWDILLVEMVQSIASYLHRLDCIHFRAVCKANRAIMPMEKFSASKQREATKSLYAS
ncbi:uncharacterized protein LOC113275502 isoform X3 [Papaver somniferum]|uniref:uncharacterized protein LOC113275502 isoform X3 n=1 Tax=Papaver somniferum TaxID=3469 RepID=UPI000E6FD1A3|nr:uncharacterized protein LOC113275502 isoform X3 [Papaver somniferum]